MDTNDGRIGVWIGAMLVLGLPMLTMTSILLQDRPSEAEREAGRVEMVVGNAERCLESPQMWDRWAQIASDYNTGEYVRCEEWVERYEEFLDRADAR